MSFSWSNTSIIKAPTIKLVGAYFFISLDKRLGLLHNRLRLQG